MQTKRGSVFELACNYGSGFFLAWAAWQWAAVPLIDWLGTCGYSYWSPMVGFATTVLMTIVSLIRSYFWRRLFNYYIVKEMSSDTRT